jgi:hypothetical protein
MTIYLLVAASSAYCVACVPKLSPWQCGRCALEQAVSVQIWTRLLELRPDNFICHLRRLSWHWAPLFNTLLVRTERISLSNRQIAGLAAAMASQSLLR